MYSDRHGIFTKHDPEDGQPTQFQRALGSLDITGIQALTPQAKGRVERLFQTLQDRLVKALRLAGMDWFDAVCHAFAALSLGGFSTHDASVGYFNSVPIEVVLSFFMLLAAMNFATHFLAIRDRNIRHYIRDSEAKSMLALIAISILAVSGYLTWMGIYDFVDALRHVSFNLISIATDSGFASTDFSVWPVAAPLWMLLLSCITACAGSTGGGIKTTTLLVLIMTVVSYMQSKNDVEIMKHKIDKLAVYRTLTVTLLSLTAVILCFSVLYFTLPAAGWGAGGV